MKVRLGMILMLLASGLLVACGQDASVSAQEGDDRVQGEVSIDKDEVMQAARSACGALPLDGLGDRLNVDVPSPDRLADRFAEPWPAELQDAVRRGCRRGLGA